MSSTIVPMVVHHFLAHLRSSSELKEGSLKTIVVADTNRRNLHTSLSLASHFVAPLIPQSDHGYCTMMSELVNNLKVCMCHEWTWWLGQLFGSGDVPSLKFLAGPSTHSCMPRYVPRCAVACLGRHKCTNWWDSLSAYNWMHAAIIVVCTLIHIDVGLWVCATTTILLSHYNLLHTSHIHKHLCHMQSLVLCDYRSNCNLGV